MRTSVVTLFNVLYLFIEYLLNYLLYLPITYFTQSNMVRISIVT